MVLGPRLLYSSKACFAGGLSSVNEGRKAVGCEVGDAFLVLWGGSEV